MIEWTKEKIAERSNEELGLLRENAAKRGRQDIVELCNDELACRKPPRVKKAPMRVGEDHRDQYVSEFHFVCPNEDGIVRNQDGTVWTGTWVVSELHARNAEKYGALVALHASKADPSYLQGTVSAWRKSPRQPQYSGDQQTQIEEGIDFLFQPSNLPLPWTGDGTGEKGYAWALFP